MNAATTVAAPLTVLCSASVGSATNGLNGQVVANGSVYVTTQDMKVVAVDAATCRVLWMTLLDRPIVYAPVYDDGRVFVLTAGGPVGTLQHVVALNATTGAVEWQSSLTSDHGTDGATPTVSNGVVYVAGGDWKIHAFDAVTGALLWRTIVDDGAVSSPTVGNGVLYATTVNQATLYAIDPLTGQILWQRFGGSNGDMNNPIVSGNVIYTGGDAGIQAIDATTHNILWTTLVPSSATCTPALANGTLYKGDHSGTIYALNATTGQVLWIYHAGGTDCAAVVATNSTILVRPYQQGGIVALDPASGAVESDFALPGVGFATSPALGPTALYVASTDGRLYALAKATLQLTTTASGPVTVGWTINDTAHLSGGFGTLSGTISFDVFAPGDTNCSTPLSPAPTGATVSGAGDYTSGPFTTSALGDYHWIAHYSGDANNKAVSTACGDAGETSTVTEGPAIAISKTPHSQTITVGGTAAWRIIVTNSGNVPLTNVQVTDVLAPNCNATFSGTLAVGASEPAYSCSLANVTAGLTNEADVSGTSPGGQTVTAKDTAVVIVQTPQGLIAPTQTRCQDFVTGTAATLSQINYPVPGGLIGQGINPGAYFYYTKITTTSSNQVVTVSQSNTSTNGAALFKILNGQALLYTSSCSVITRGTVIAGGSGASFTVASPGTYIIGIKYTTKSIVGTPAPVPANITYYCTASLGGTTSASVKLVKE
jgi:uncharacterized repeat protein (TIGR01451 family)